MAAYEAAMNQKAPPVGAGNVKNGSLRALAASYYQSIAFLALKPITQNVYRSLAEKLCRQLDKSGAPVGDKSAATIQRHHIEKLMAARMDQPESANNVRRILRELMKHAISKGWRKDDPTAGIAKVARPNGKIGFHRWTEDEIEQFQKRHPVGSKARLALALALYTGQARQDVCTMGPQHVRDGVLYWVRMKTRKSTGIQLAIPIHPELRVILDATPSGHLTFLITEFGQPFSRKGFGGWFKRRCEEAGLPHCSMHGLRKATATRMAEAGCSASEIMAITGHASIRQVQHYIEEADRKRLAASGMAKIKTRTASG